MTRTLCARCRPPKAQRRRRRVREWPVHQPAHRHCTNKLIWGGSEKKAWHFSSKNCQPSTPTQLQAAPLPTPFNSSNRHRDRHPDGLQIRRIFHPGQIVIGNSISSTRHQQAPVLSLETTPHHNTCQSMTITLTHSASGL